MDPEEMNAMDRILRANQRMCITDTNIYREWLLEHETCGYLPPPFSVQRFSITGGWHSEFRIPQCHHMFRRFLPLAQIRWWFCVCTLHHFPTIWWVRFLH